MSNNSSNGFDRRRALSQEELETIIDVAVMRIERRIYKTLLGGALSFIGLIALALWETIKPVLEWHK